MHDWEAQNITRFLLAAKAPESDVWHTTGFGTLEHAKRIEAQLKGHGYDTRPITKAAK